MDDFTLEFLNSVEREAPAPMASVREPR
jgi:hypothetical protein